RVAGRSRIRGGTGASGPGKPGDGGVRGRRHAGKSGASDADQRRGADLRAGGAAEAIPAAPLEREHRYGGGSGARALRGSAAIYGSGRTIQGSFGRCGGITAESTGDSAL